MPELPGARQAGSRVHNHGSGMRRLFQRTDSSDLQRKRAADLPVMAEWIDHAAQTPPVRFVYREDFLSACLKCLREHRIRIRYGQDHPSRTAAQRFWTEVAILRGLVTQPKLRTFNGQPRYHRTGGILHTVDLDRPKCRLIELNRSRAIPHRKHGRDRTYDGSPRARVCAHLCLPILYGQLGGRKLEELSVQLIVGAQTG